MTTLEELEARVAALEDRIRIESGTRAAMDEELGTATARLRALTGVLTALRETQAEHTARLTRIDDRLTEILRRLPEPPDPQPPAAGGR